MLLSTTHLLDVIIAGLKKVNIRQVILGGLVLLLLIWPLILFLYVNYVSHKEIEILGLTITKMAVSRGGS